MKTLVVHVVPHSHLDREWYMPFEKHHLREAALVENLKQLFSKDPDYRCFHMDGHTVTYEDYLAIHPEDREEVHALVKRGRLSAGPWYILQDEFLTSGESNVRNLMYGMEDAKKLGAVSRIGYFPDSFGNAGQMPQLLKQAGMKGIVFGRGVLATGEEDAGAGGDYNSAHSEMRWVSPDGSSLPAVLFANWYNNGMEIPVDERKARAYWEERLPKAERYASTRHLLFMNGCDHQPVQQDLSEALSTARKLYPDIDFVQDSLQGYFDAVLKEFPKDPDVVRGELTGQGTDGYGTLVNTCSSRIDLKIRNRMSETALEKKAEPLSVFSLLSGYGTDEDALHYYWKMLMKNHPHDSICGCSVDDVNRDVKTRFEDALAGAGGITEEAAKNIASGISRANGIEEEKDDVYFVLFNTDGKERVRTADVTVDIARKWGDLTEAYDGMEGEAFPELALEDMDGNPVDAVIRDAGTGFGYTLPDDRFRRPYMARRARVLFEADVPALGWRVYRLKKRNTVAAGQRNQAGPEEGSISEGRPGMEEKSAREDRVIAIPENVIENAFIRVEVAPDGSYTLTDKANGRSYPRIGWFEDCGAIGNEYIFVEDEKRERVTSLGTRADIEKTEDNSVRAAIRIRQTILVPESADETLERDRRRCVPPFERTCGRSGRRVPFTLETTLTLSKSSRSLSVNTSFTNTAKDHRLRVMIPTGLSSDFHYADSTFEVVRRPNRHSASWKNPSGCEHEQNFVCLEDDRTGNGILAANFGIYEYEILPDDGNTIALTLLRSSAEMGDWGDFPTPEAELLGEKLTCRYEIVPFGTDGRLPAYDEGYAFQNSFIFRQLPTGACGMVPPEEEKEHWLPETGRRITGACRFDASFLDAKGDGITMTGCKISEDGRDVILRFVNVTDENRRLKIRKKDWMADARICSVIESGSRKVPETDGAYHVTFRPHRIITFRIRPDFG